MLVAIDRAPATASARSLASESEARLLLSPLTAEDPMPRSPSLVLTVFLVATLASSTVRGGWSQPPGAPSAAPSPLAPEAGAVGAEQAPGLLHQTPAPRAPRRTGLMIGGLTTLGVTYLVTVLVVLRDLGGGTNGMTYACGDECKARPRLMVPILGPWLAMPYAGQHDAPLFTVLGLAQAAGVVLSIVGISRFVSDAPTHPVSVGVLPVSDGAFGFATARF